MKPWTDRSGRFFPLKAATFTLLWVPALWLLFDAMTGGLGPRPLDQAIHFSGDWTIRILLASLAVTPFRRIFNLPRLIAIRRMLGVAALFYALLHFSLYIADQNGSLTKVASEIVLRVYLLIGFVALLGLAILGSTSFDAAIQRMGPAWGKLHQIVYAIGVLAIIHYFMQTKLDVYQATLMAGLFILLMIYRIAAWRGFDLANPFALAALAIGGTVLTAGAELLWYELATGVPIARVLQANFQFGFQIRPSWWVLGVGLAVSVISALRSYYGPARPPVRRREIVRVA